MTIRFSAERCKIGTAPQNDWYFFSHKDKKYPAGTRTNRATAAGFWKATGRDKVIYGTGKRVGMRKTLVFYKGRAPHGQKSDWIMHEYRLDDNPSETNVSLFQPWVSGHVCIIHVHISKMFYLCQGLQCYGRGSTGRWLGGLPYLQEEKSQQNPRQSYEFITHHCRYQEPDVKFLQ